MGELKKELLANIENIQALTTSSKWKKMMHDPFRYLGAQLFRRLFYPLTQKGKMTTANTFFGTTMKLQLPSAMDIYLWGAKTHNSEIRLSKFLIRNLKEGQEFMDVGVHFGFFSLLAAKLTGKEGKVTSIEASPEMFAIFQENCQSVNTIKALNIAASSESKMINFFEFPILFSEYNTLFPEQYATEKWYQKRKGRKVFIQAHPLDKIIKSEQLSPSLIKIDVEGAELDVLQGLSSYLQSHAPTIVMEYLNQERHQQAVLFTQSLGYQTYLINSDGRLTPISDLSNIWKKEYGLDSDNIVLKPTK